MVSAASTAIWFWIPDTLRLAQWPVITTLLVIPLTLTLPPLQAMVRASLMPETVMFSPAGAVDTDVVGIDGGVAFVGGMVAVPVGPAVGMLGMGEKVVMPLRETWCAVKRKIAAGRAIMPMTKTPRMIHNVRLLRGYWADGLGNKPPP
ncbi:MAG: hypothetical protein QOG14_4591 [Mycobacterium sp.]|nr:hypothetical protein [Mycobacterium sp.]